MKTYPVVLRMLRAAVCIAFLTALMAALTGFASLEADCQGISDKVLRLHILANSDSGEDQALKIQVRDRVLQESQALFTASQNKQEAMAQVQQRLPDLQRIAQEEVYAQGYDYPVTVGLSQTYFPTKQYDTVTFPAGQYDALQIRIGEAQGQNWWCVLFPSLCVPAASGVQMDDVLDASELDLVEHGQAYQVKFKVVEWYEGFMDGRGSW